MPKRKLLALLLASLICNAAGGLASRLAGGLALAAAAGLDGLLKITGVDSNDSLHYENSFSDKYYTINVLNKYNVFCRLCQDKARI